MLYAFEVDYNTICFRKLKIQSTIVQEPDNWRKFGLHCRNKDNEVRSGWSKTEDSKAVLQDIEVNTESIRVTVWC